MALSSRARTLARIAAFAPFFTGCDPKPPQLSAPPPPTLPDAPPADAGGPAPCEPQELPNDQFPALLELRTSDGTDDSPRED